MNLYNVHQLLQSCCFYLEKVVKEVLPHSILKTSSYDISFELGLFL